eukprot:TRINITY_DN5059_c0_g1_i1.p1 TRINITY_DN5059_c0_g1~~TRINITY_DN5059_c0_g1_i1.p1  ORF type:complete len:400 (+),score=75.90 TRINITY_DN5059_c0_g1_i1:95-1294(+)
MPLLSSSPKAKAVRPGVLSKHGRLRIKERKEKTHRRANWQDAFNWLLSHNTFWILFFFAASHILSYAIFASLWYLIHYNDSTCLAEISTFNEAFLFSVETQSTIGYGSKHVLGSCEWGIVLLLLQNICGTLLEAAMVGLILARITRPDRRAYTLRCSTRAVVSNRDGSPHLLIRVADMRQKESPLIDCQAKLYMLSEYMTSEGEVLPYHCQSLEIEQEDLLLALPTCVAHKITPDSPLANIRTQEDLEAIKAEFIFVLEGTISDLGLNLELRTSYVPEEVMFGYRFETICTRLSSGKCEVDWTRFDNMHNLSAQNEQAVSPLSPVMFAGNNNLKRRSSMVDEEDSDGRRLSMSSLFRRPRLASSPAFETSNGIGQDRYHASVDGATSEAQLIPRSISEV